MKAKHAPNLATNLRSRDSEKLFPRMLSNSSHSSFRSKLSLRKERPCQLVLNNQEQQKICTTKVLLERWPLSTTNVRVD